MGNGPTEDTPAQIRRFVSVGVASSDVRIENGDCPRLRGHGGVAQPPIESYYVFEAGLPPTPGVRR